MLLATFASMKEKNEKMLDEVIETLNESCLDINTRISVVNKIISLRYESVNEGIQKGVDILNSRTK